MTTCPIMEGNLMSKITTRTCLLILVCFYLGSVCSARTSPRPRRASIEYSGKTIFTLNYAYSSLCADSIWETFLGVAEVVPLQPTEHFSEEIGVFDGDWLVIKNVNKTSLGGLIEIRGDGSGVTWVERFRVQKQKTPDALGRIGWLLDVNSLRKVRTKRFIGRKIVSSLKASEAAGPPAVNTGNSNGASFEAPLESNKGKLVINVLVGQLLVLQTTLQSEISEPDRLWNHCINEILQRNVDFQKTKNAPKILFLERNGGSEKNELIFERSEESRVMVHVEGLGISFLNKLVFNKKKSSKDSFWLVESAEGLGKESWAIRRNLVPYLKEPDK